MPLPGKAEQSAGMGVLAQNDLWKTGGGLAAFAAPDGAIKDQRAGGVDLAKLMQFQNQRARAELAGDAAQRRVAFGDGAQGPIAADPQAGAVIVLRKLEHGGVRQVALLRLA